MNNEPRLTASLLSACPPDDAQQRRIGQDALPPRQHFLPFF